MDTAPRLRRQTIGEEVSSVPPRVSLVSITKRFGDNVANDAITLDIRPGEITPY